MMMMEGIKEGGGGGVNDVVGHLHDQDQDMGDGMQCSDHPYRNNPGGICAFCLQEKLGKLVSSSFPLPTHASTSSSSPSFRSDVITGAVHSGHNGNNGVAGPSSAAASLSHSLSVHHPTSSSSSAKPRSNLGNNIYRRDDEYNNTRRARISFLLANNKKKVSTTTTSTTTASTVPSGDRRAADVVYKRSKSTTTPRRGHNHFLDGSYDFSPRKRGGFWSFLYHSSTTKSSSSNALNKKAIDKSSFRDNSNSKISSSSSFTSSAQKDTKPLGTSSLAVESAADEDSASPNSSQATSSFERKVSRSRSVGCGSRSFSGDFFERISTGFGDCTLRRVESQREGKPKVSVHRGHHHHGEHNSNNHCMKERVKCGGIFSGFMMTSSSSSSYWVPSSSAEGPLIHGRSRSWGWAFASPMRAFSKPSSKDGKGDIVRQASDKNTTPNLNAIPSLLSARG